MPVEYATVRNGTGIPVSRPSRCRVVAMLRHLFHWPDARIKWRVVTGWTSHSQQERNGLHEQYAVIARPGMNAYSGVMFDDPVAAYDAVRLHRPEYPDVTLVYRLAGGWNS